MQRRNTFDCASSQHVAHPLTNLPPALSPPTRLSNSHTRSLMHHSMASHDSLLIPAIRLSFPSSSCHGGSRDTLSRTLSRTISRSRCSSSSRGSSPPRRPRPSDHDYNHTSEENSDPHPQSNSHSHSHSQHSSKRRLLKQKQQRLKQKEEEEEEQQQQQQKQQQWELSTDLRYTVTHTVKSHPTATSTMDLIHIATTSPPAIPLLVRLLRARLSRPQRRPGAVRLVHDLVLHVPYFFRYIASPLFLRALARHADTAAVRTLVAAWARDLHLHHLQRDPAASFWVSEANRLARRGKLPVVPKRRFVYPVHHHYSLSELVVDISDARDKQSMKHRRYYYQRETGTLAPSAPVPSSRPVSEPEAAPTPTGVLKTNSIYAVAAVAATAAAAVAPTGLKYPLYLNCMQPISVSQRILDRLANYAHTPSASIVSSTGTPPSPPPSGSPRQARALLRRGDLHRAIVCSSSLEDRFDSREEWRADTDEHYCDDNDENGTDAELDCTHDNDEDRRMSDNSKEDEISPCAPDFRWQKLHQQSANRDNIAQQQQHMSLSPSLLPDAENQHDDQRPGNHRRGHHRRPKVKDDQNQRFNARVLAVLRRHDYAFGSGDPYYIASPTMRQPRNRRTTRPLRTAESNRSVAAVARENARRKLQEQQHESPSSLITERNMDGNNHNHNNRNTQNGQYFQRRQFSAQMPGSDDDYTFGFDTEEERRRGAGQRRTTPSPRDRVVREIGFFDTRAAAPSNEETGGSGAACPPSAEGHTTTTTNNCGGPSLLPLSASSSSSSSMSPHGGSSHDTQTAAIGFSDSDGDIEGIVTESDGSQRASPSPAPNHSNAVSYTPSPPQSSGATVNAIAVAAAAVAGSSWTKGGRPFVEFEQPYGWGSTH